MPKRRTPEERLEEFLEWQEHRYDGHYLDRHRLPPLFYRRRHSKRWALFLLFSAAILFTLTTVIVMGEVQSPKLAPAALVTLLVLTGGIGLVLAIGGLLWLRQASLNKKK